MKFTRSLRSIVALVAAMTLSFAAGGAPAQADPPENPFAGSWSGTWSVAEIEVDGTFDWTISDAGRITGTVTHTQSGGSGAIKGHVGADGKLTFVGFAPNDVPAGGGGVPFQGTAVIDGDGKLVVAVTRTDSTGFSLAAILERN